MMTIKQAFQSWLCEIKPQVIEQFGPDDGPALDESWSEYTDGLCKDGELTDLQYCYCPDWTDSMPDNDIEYVLESMNIEWDILQIPYRNDGLMADMPSGSRHYKFWLQREDTPVTISGIFSQGPGIKAQPDIEDILESLILDWSSICDVDHWREFADGMGFYLDVPEEAKTAQKVYKAICNQSKQLLNTFTEGQLEQFSEMINEL